MSSVYPPFKQLPKTVRQYIQGILTVSDVRSKKFTVDQLQEMKWYYKDETSEYHGGTNFS